MHAGEVTSTELGKDGEVVGVRLGSGDSVEDADELVVSRFADRFNDFVDHRRVLVIEDLGRPTALAEVKVVRASDRDDVNSGGRRKLSRHGADRR